MSNEAKYTSKQVAAAIGIELRDFMSWHERGIFKLDPYVGDIESGGTGQPRRFTLHTLLKAGVMAELVRLSLKPREAFAMASRWSDHGRGPLPGAPERKPGQLFDGAYTALCRFPDGSFDVKCIKPDSKATELFLHTLGRELQPGVLIVLIDQIVKKVCADLEKQGE